MLTEQAGVGATIETAIGAVAADRSVGRLYPFETLLSVRINLIAALSVRVASRSRTQSTGKWMLAFTHVQSANTSSSLHGPVDSE